MRKTILSTIIILIVLIAHSQENSEKVKFGFSLGTNYSMIKSDHQVIKDAEITSTPGFNVGIIMNYAITQNIEFAPKFDLALNFLTINGGSPKSEYQVMPTSIDAMLHLKYKFGQNSLKPYLICGPGYRQPIGNPKTIEEGFPTKPDLFLDFGIGLENKFEFFYFAPELRYSYGLWSVNENPLFPTFNLHKITLAFNFH